MVQAELGGHQQKEGWQTSPLWSQEGQHQFQGIPQVCSSIEGRSNDQV